MNNDLKSLKLLIQGRDRKSYKRRFQGNKQIKTGLYGNVLKFRFRLGYNPNLWKKGDQVTIWEILLIALGLAMDCFCVALGVGTTNVKKSARNILRLAFFFGFFQGGMALIGWFAGTRIVNLISGFDHWVAFGLLVFVGGRMVKESFSSREECPREDVTRGWSLIMLSIATSIDALAVGLSLALVDGSILNNGLIIGVVSFVLTVVGFRLGNRLGDRFGKHMELVGGLILISIGIKVLVSHIFAL